MPDTFPYHRSLPNRIYSRNSNTIISRLYSKYSLALMVLWLTRWILCRLYNKRFRGVWKFDFRSILARPEHSLGDVSTLATQASHDIAELKHVSNFNWVFAAFVFDVNFVMKRKFFFAIIGILLVVSLFSLLRNTTDLRSFFGHSYSRRGKICWYLVILAVAAVPWLWCCAINNEGKLRRHLWKSKTVLSCFRWESE